jgi:HEAT repeat protein
MGFDIQNFGIGLLTGWASAYGVYRARHLIRSAVQSVSQGAARAQSYASQSSDGRYINGIVQMARSNHLASHLFKLDDILVEPRFAAAPRLAAPAEDEAVHSAYQIVPHVPDFPQLEAAYNLPSMSIDDLSLGTRRLAILGNPGSGRTTALMAILLRSLGKLRFQKQFDALQERLNQEEAQLDEKERAVRIKERILLEQKARERLAEQYGMALEEQAGGNASIPLFNRLMPIYIHLADVHPGESATSGIVDPAEPLVRSVQRQIGRVAASTIPRSLYRRLENGQVLLLVDGYDDLPTTEQPLKLAWLEVLISTYPGNFIIVVAPTTGYGTLVQRLDLTPIYLRPWNDRDRDQFITRWVEAWPSGRGRKTTLARPTDECIEQARERNTGLSAIEMTLKTLACLSGTEAKAPYQQWLYAYLKQRLPAKAVTKPIENIITELTTCAGLELNEGAISAARLTMVLTTEVSTIKAAESQLGDGTEAPAKTEPLKTEVDKKAQERINTRATFLNQMWRIGLLIRLPNGHYRFRSPVLTAYFASLGLKDVPEETLAQRAAQPGWNQVVGFAASQVILSNVVRGRLNAVPDLLQNSVLAMTNWLPYASADADWRGHLLRYLRNVLVAPNQFPLLRERAAAALAASRDPLAGEVFRQALQSIVPQIRLLACLGCGAVKDVDAVPLLQNLLQDENADVQVAAVLALGAIHTEEAVNGLVQALTEGSERVRQAAAEALADLPEQGYPILYEAIQDEDMLVRRAAVFGLRRVPSDWAMVWIYRAYLEDSQWYVRSAGQIAFEARRAGSDLAPLAYPAVESIQWLNEWAADQGESVPPGDEAKAVMLKALQEGDVPIRSYAAANIGQLGIIEMVKPLYKALRDGRAEVREAAHRALGDLQIQAGRPLPNPL